MKIGKSYRTNIHFSLFKTNKLTDFVFHPHTGNFRVVSESASFMVVGLGEIIREDGGTSGNYRIYQILGPGFMGWIYIHCTMDNDVDKFGRYESTARKQVLDYFEELKEVDELE